MKDHESDCSYHKRFTPSHRKIESSAALEQDMLFDLLDTDESDSISMQAGNRLYFSIFQLLV